MTNDSNNAINMDVILKDLFEASNRIANNGRQFNTMGAFEQRDECFRISESISTAISILKNGRRA